MKIIVPMAGRGSRLRPHTLTVPKPLIPIAGKPIVQRLVEDIAKVVAEPIDEIAFIIGKDFGKGVEEKLENIATGLNARASIYIQDQPLGTGHAIMSAKPSLSGPAVVAYADTLFKADFSIPEDTDAMIWVKQVDNPRAFGVVNVNEKGHITDLVEKPEHPESDLAVIGIYYFKDVSILKDQLQEVLDENIVRGGEYQINDGIEKMKAKGYIFKPGKVDEWMDCGNKTVTVETNNRILEHLKSSDEKLISDHIEIHNSEITEPCFIADGVKLINAKIGPYVSLGKGTIVKDTTLKNSLVQENAEIINANLNNAMIGNFAKFDGEFTSISIGDYSVLE
jgi:glucose-1-phosphate thymidylyltransferase